MLTARFNNDIITSQNKHGHLKNLVRNDSK